jgi:paraquat-inducible protein A
LAAHRWTSLNWAAAFAIAALILFPASMLLPVLELEKLGHTRTVTVWSGAVDLMSDGQVLVGILVFACSIVVPILKMLGIVWLSFTRADGNAASRARLHGLIDWVGRWSMLDVLLVAVLVAAIKLGNWADIHAGTGVLAFAAVVVLSLLASAVFDPHALWEGEQ